MRETLRGTRPLHRALALAYINADALAYPLRIPFDMAPGQDASNRTGTAQGKATCMPDQRERRTVPTNIYRSEDRVTLAALMPGVEPEDIHVEVTSDRRLILDGAWRGSLKGINEIIQNEWQAGGYYRELTLPSSVDGSLANLTFGNGVLVVVLPLSDTLRPARLSLKAIGPAQGERVGNTGHPVRPLTEEEHHAAHSM